MSTEIAIGIKKESNPILPVSEQILIEAMTKMLRTQNFIYHSKLKDSILQGKTVSIKEIQNELIQAILLSKNL